MKELLTDIDIQSSPERVWQILTDFASFSAWNPFICRVIGEAEMGKEVSICLRSLGSRETTLRCTILKLEPNRELRWKWHILLPAMYGGEHSFLIEPREGDSVHFVERETFSGWLVPLFAKEIDTNSKRGFEEMDKALKARAEQAA